jgi:hypothetical protein
VLTGKGGFDCPSAQWIEQRKEFGSLGSEKLTVPVPDWVASVAKLENVIPRTASRSTKRLKGFKIISFLVIKVVIA